MIRSSSRPKPRAAARPALRRKKVVSQGADHSTPPRPGQRKDVFSLWLLPQGETRRRLRRVIARLARRCGTMPFEPHVTLLGGISLPRSLVIERMAALARSLRPFAVRLRGVGHEAAFFRCLYLRAAASGLRRARALAEQAFAEGTIPYGEGHQAAARAVNRFRPHLSLVYGRLPSPNRRTLAKECLEEINRTVTVRQIALVRTSGHPRTWRVVASRRLGPFALRLRRAGLS